MERASSSSRPLPMSRGARCSGGSPSSWAMATPADQDRRQALYDVSARCYRINGPRSLTARSTSCRGRRGTRTRRPYSAASSIAHPHDGRRLHRGGRAQPLLEDVLMRGPPVGGELGKLRDNPCAHLHAAKSTIHELTIACARDRGSNITRAADTGPSARVTGAPRGRPNAPRGTGARSLRRVRAETRRRLDRLRKRPPAPSTRSPRPARSWDQPMSRASIRADDRPRSARRIVERHARRSRGRGHEPRRAGCAVRAGVDRIGGSSASAKLAPRRESCWSSASRWSTNCGVNGARVVTVRPHHLGRDRGCRDPRDPAVVPRGASSEQGHRATPSRHLATATSHTRAMPTPVRAPA